jgi:predicted nuclease with TOPRIM domain
MASLEQKLIEQINSALKVKTKVLNERLDSLEFENNQLKDRLKDYENKINKKLREIEENVNMNYDVSTEASRRANYNEQYSRKNNVKIM